MKGDRPDRLAVRLAEVNYWEGRVIDTANGAISGTRPTVFDRLIHPLTPKVSEVLDWMDSQRRSLEAHSSVEELAGSALKRYATSPEHVKREIFEIWKEAGMGLMNAENRMRAPIRSSARGLDVEATYQAVHNADPNGQHQRRLAEAAEEFAYKSLARIRELTGDPHLGSDSPAALRFMRRAEDQKAGQERVQIVQLLSQPTELRVPYTFETPVYVQQRETWVPNDSFRPVTFREVISGDFNPKTGRGRVRHPEQIIQNFQTLTEGAKRLQKEEGPLWKNLEAAEETLDEVRLVYAERRPEAPQPTRVRDIQRLQRARESLQRTQMTLKDYAKSSEADVKSRWDGDDYDHFKARMALLNQRYELALNRVSNYHDLLDNHQVWTDPLARPPSRMESLRRMERQETTARTRGHLAATVASVGAFGLAAAFNQENNAEPTQWVKTPPPSPPQEKRESAEPIPEALTVSDSP